MGIGRFIYTNHVRIAAEPGHRQDFAADPTRIDNCVPASMRPLTS
jgi:hypothetical protein